MAKTSYLFNRKGGAIIKTSPQKLFMFNLELTYNTNQAICKTTPIKRSHPAPAIPANSPMPPRAMAIAGGLLAIILAVVLIIF